MGLNSFISNQGTQTSILTDNTGGTAGTVIAVQKVDISGQGTAGTLWNGGVTGTINSGSISVIAGTIASDTVIGGTLQNVGTVPGIGSVSSLGSLGMVNAGTISMLNAGTLTTIPNIPGGTINILAGGTLGILTDGTLSNSGTVTGVGSISSIGSLGMLSAGTLTTIPNIPGGTINILAGGTLGILTNGTLSSSGTTTGVGSVSNLGSMAMLTAGTISMINAGTISVLPNVPGGTLNLVTTVSNLTNGSVSINAGTINSGTINTGTTNLGSVVKITPAASAGSFTAAGSIVVSGSQFDYAGFDIGGTWVGTVFTEAQIGTSGWFAVPNVSNLGVVGTAFTGNGDYFMSMSGLDGVRARLTYSSGTLTYNARQSNFFAPTTFSMGGTIGNIGSIGMINAATISSLPNLPQGSINVTAGTIGTVTGVGTMTNIGSVTNLGQVYNAGTIQNMLAGTMTALQNGTIVAGSIIVTAGTVSAGTVNTGTVNVGTVYKGVAAGQAGSLTAAGTITAAGSQLDLTYWDIGGTWVGTAFFEAQVGTSTFFAANVITPTGVVGTLTTGNGDYMQSMAGIDNARLRVTYSSGTLTYNNRSSNFFAPIHYMLGGTLGNVGSVTNLGMLNAGTISVLPNLPQGSINVTAGTIGTVTGMGTLTNLGQVYNAGTLQGGTINTGTVVISSITSGSINVGTMVAGTINVGTINTGTFRGDARTTQNIVSYGTNIANSGAAAATIVGSASVGAGTSLWLQDMSILNPNSAAATIILGFGTTQQGTNVLFRGILGTNGAVGIEKAYAKAVNAGMTNQDLVISSTGAGTFDLSLSYFISA